MSNHLPDSWLRQALGCLVTVQGGNAFKSDDFCEQGIPVNRISNIKSGVIDLTEAVFAKESPSFSKFLALNGDVLVAMSGATTGKIGRYRIDRPAYINQRVGRFVVKDKKSVSIDYIYHLSGAETFQAKLLIDAIGGAQPNISNSSIEALTVDVPPIVEQQKIASILTAVDEVIESTQAQINKLKDLKTGMMQELLTKGIGRDGQPHTEFKDSPVGRIPKAWTFKAVGDICKVTSGGTPDRTNLEFWNGNIPWIKTGEINYTTIYSAEEYITELGLKNSSTKLIPAGSVLMAMYGQGITRGKVALLGIDACLNQACLAMLPNNELDKYFLFYFFSKEYENLRLLVQEGTQKNLNAGIVKEILLPLPPMDEQVEIRKRLQAVDINIESKQRKLEIVVDLKKALMQDLLTGNVRVP